MVADEQGEGTAGEGEGAEVRGGGEEEEEEEEDVVG